MKKLGVYELENDLDFDCDAQLRDSYINDLRFMTAEEQRQRIIELVIDGVIVRCAHKLYWGEE